MTIRDEGPHPSHADLYHKLGILEGKLDAHLTFTDKTSEDINELETRVSSLEALKWKIIGMASSAAVVASVLFNAADWFVQHGHRLVP